MEHIQESNNTPASIRNEPKNTHASHFKSVKHDACVGDLSGETAGLPDSTLSTGTQREHAVARMEYAGKEFYRPMWWPSGESPVGNEGSHPGERESFCPLSVSLVTLHEGGSGTNQWIEECCPSTLISATTSRGGVVRQLRCARATISLEVAVTVEASAWCAWGGGG